MFKRKIKVLIIDDSSFFRQALSLHLEKDVELQVVGEAPNASIAAELIEACDPDVITLDVEMPGMNGIDFLRKIMPRYAVPCVVVSSVSTSVFDALEAGAVDFVTKPDSSATDGYVSFIKNLIIKIKVAFSVNRSLLRRFKDNTSPQPNPGSEVKVIAIGASTGGTEALQQIIAALPSNMPGILIVQHMPPVFTRMYAERLNNICRLEVKEAEDGDKLCPGRVLIAAGEYHMKLRKTTQGFFVQSERGERVSGHCPSVDVLFQSVAESAGKEAVGVILTGMGGDGAKGLLEMRRRGAQTIGQDAATSVIYGMPRTAYELGAVAKQLPIQDIAQELTRLSAVTTV